MRFMRNLNSPPSECQVHTANVRGDTNKIKCVHLIPQNRTELTRFEPAKDQRIGIKIGVFIGRPPSRYP
jgi:hypothetical protein